MLKPFYRIFVFHIVVWYVNVFVDENVPHFPPTYRYKRGNRESYEHIKVKRAAVVGLARLIFQVLLLGTWCDIEHFTSDPP